MTEVLDVRIGSRLGPGFLFTDVQWGHGGTSGRASTLGVSTDLCHDQRRRISSLHRFRMERSFCGISLGRMGRELVGRAWLYCRRVLISAMQINSSTNTIELSTQSFSEEPPGVG